MKIIDPDFYRAQKVIRRQKRIERLERELEKSIVHDTERDKQAKKDYQVIQKFLANIDQVREEQRTRTGRFALPSIYDTPGPSINPARLQSPNLVHPPFHLEDDPIHSIEELTPCQVAYIKGNYCDCDTCVHEHSIRR